MAGSGFSDYVPEEKFLGPPHQKTLLPLCAVLYKYTESQNFSWRNMKQQEARWTALPVKQFLLHGFFLPKGINNRENFGGF